VRRDAAQALDKALRPIHFEPRPSLEAEVLLRVRRVRLDDGVAWPSSLRWIGLALVLGILGALIYLFWIRLLTLTA
jgi:hypothetical protein